MAKRNAKWEDNVPGVFYVDKECILCSLCSDLAPANFKESPDADHDLVYKQPADAEELKNCRDAMEQCPVEAIGDDGDLP
jgi:ferredoxin